MKTLVQHYCNDKAVLVGVVTLGELLDSGISFSHRRVTDDVLYQRPTDDDRVARIRPYIEDRISNNDRVLFPTPLIIAFDGRIDNDSPDYIDINLPNEKGSILIVDGQHRYKALHTLVQHYHTRRDEAMVSKLRACKLCCTILLNYDLWEQSLIFADVNFNQKPVNRSLFYDIYGIVLPSSDELVIPKQNEIYLSHQIVSLLNTSERSVFNGKIKMLGNGEGYISQAFFVERLIKMFSPRGIWNEELNAWKQDNSQAYRYIYYELEIYFGIVANKFSGFWPSDCASRPKSNIYKTTGISALLMLLSDIHREIDRSTIIKMRQTPGDMLAVGLMANLFHTRLGKLIPAQERLFSTEKEFRGTGESLQQSLYKEMCKLIYEK